MSVLGSLGHEDCEFEFILGYIVKHSQKVVMKNPFSVFINFETGSIVYLWLTWNLLYRAGWLQTYRYLPASTFLASPGT